VLGRIQNHCAGNKRGGNDQPYDYAVNAFYKLGTHRSKSGMPELYSLFAFGGLIENIMDKLWHQFHMAANGQRVSSDIS
jgi:hypothetical protein